MSIFTKIIWKIVKPEVLKEIKKSMEKFLPQLIKLVEKYGTKFLVALAGIYFVYDLAIRIRFKVSTPPQSLAVLR